MIRSFQVLQIGDLAAQMALQGREGMASCCCIKCDLTQNEWKLGQTHTLLNINDTIRIGQKRDMLWEICPSNTVVPILHCQMGTVNDQLYNKLFH